MSPHAYSVPPPIEPPTQTGLAIAAIAVVFLLMGLATFRGYSCDRVLTVPDDAAVAVLELR